MALRSSTNANPQFFPKFLGDNYFLKMEMKFSIILIPVIKLFEVKKQPSRGILRKRCSDNMQQTYRRTSMPKCDFHKVARQL